MQTHTNIYMYINTNRHRHINIYISLCTYMCVCVEAVHHPGLQSLSRPALLGLLGGREHRCGHQLLRRLIGIFCKLPRPVTAIKWHRRGCLLDGLAAMVLGKRDLYSPKDSTTLRAGCLQSRRLYHPESGMFIVQKTLPP